ncbi:unnamed protein product [Pleuronectes platessa]|uniref:Uncharacterized protein n=1 Tax=Pleuronectes platessa TaxID=8262 RepID=A0A9N7TTR2_PLEPL|nr:unnamed protein product [Pleuronectes platessa]
MTRKCVRAEPRGKQATASTDVSEPAVLLLPFRGSHQSMASVKTACMRMSTETRVPTRSNTGNVKQSDGSAGYRKSLPVAGVTSEPGDVSAPLHGSSERRRLTETALCCYGTRPARDSGVFVHVRHLSSSRQEGAARERLIKPSSQPSDSQEMYARGRVRQQSADKNPIIFKAQ